MVSTPEPPREPGPRGLPARVTLALRVMAPERRLACLAAVGLFGSLFLPWYQTTIVDLPGAGQTLPKVSESLTGWGSFSFVEAAVLLVAAGVLLLLFARAEGRAFHLPGGDGVVVAAAGFWTCLLVIWRIFDKQGTSPSGRSLVVGSGIEWGIFLALLIAAALSWSGLRIRAAHQAEPPLPGEAPTEAFDAYGAAGDVDGARRAGEARRAREAGAARNAGAAGDAGHTRDTGDAATLPLGEDAQLTIPLGDEPGR